MNDGGIAYQRPCTATTEMFDTLMSVNVKGVFFSYKYALLRLMAQGKGGRVIGAASTAGKRGAH